RSVEGLNLIKDAHDRAMGEGYETNRANSDRAPRRRAPFGRSSQGSCPEIEHPIVGEQIAVSNVKGLIIDEQPDELAVRHVDHCLTRFRSPVLALGLQQRAQLIETVEIGSRQSMWLPLVQISAYAYVTVGECEQ